MNYKILQWNVNGLKPRYKFLQKPINTHQPIIMCIQETNFKGNQYVNIKNYDVIYKNRINSLIASGVVVTYIKNNVHSTNLQIQTEPEAVSVRVILTSEELTICNVYIPNSHNF